MPPFVPLRLQPSQVTHYTIPEYLPEGDCLALNFELKTVVYLSKTEANHPHLVRTGLLGLRDAPDA